MSLHSNEGKREEYHRYLEKSGVIEYFTRVLVDLYETPEKPFDPNEFIREQLSKFFPDDTDDLRNQIQSHEEMLNERENTLRDLQQEQYELRTALESKGVKFEDIDFEAELSRNRRYKDNDDDGDDNDNDNDGDDDDDDDDRQNEFGLSSIPKFQYHQTTNEELVQQSFTQQGEFLPTLNTLSNDEVESDDETAKLVDDGFFKTKSVKDSTSKTNDGDKDE